ncbi:hypothetical protein HN592_04900 [Candidatus Woesearchaeota archaeon]|jgi:hypothetical protein|nr:hypothetical protein [Candidatus Woesearchaeota archaeon]MBT4368551.1 hypothetical protein [Candidatus Woesearchaeota archaeon]MBT4713040.1 hypothetical protein [Candidatus Woesearchaeota archaeon]MBT6639952.1 hypothetical protein [Candidatus Woesearchaeota archaeon]MBT7134124.1 hypothetical protein [Candidatus Woesearchaeota archaeon]
MQKKIHIEHVPKLDKILRITFASVKKDFIETREEFIQLEEKVDTSLDIFRGRLKELNELIFRELKNKTDYLDKQLTNKTKDLEKQVKDIAISTDKFLDQTNAKITVWNSKILKLDENSAKAEEIGSELKKIKFLRTELERIQVLDKQVKTIDAVAVHTKDYKKDSTKLRSDINKKLERLKVGQDILKAGVTKNIDDEKAALESKISNVDKKLDLSNKTNNVNLDKLEKDISRRMLEDMESVKKLMSKKSITKKAEEIKKSFKLENVKLQKGMLELKKELNEQVAEKKSLNQEVTDLKKNLTKLASKLEKLENQKPKVIEKTKVVEKKVVEPKLEVISKKKEEKGWVRRFLNFLIEDVEEDKDKTLHEFDRKKGDKFEIKELKEIKE